MQNLARFGLSPTEIVIDERPSTQVAPEDIERAVGRVRFFHVDGGHHFEAVVHDLRLAGSVILDEGVIAVDDVFRPEWPEVSMAVFHHLGQQRELVPFAIGFNKTYLCRQPWAESCRSMLLGNDFLRIYLTKRYKVTREEVLVFQAYPLPEWSLKQRAFNYLRVRHPSLAHSVARVLPRRSHW